MIKQHNNTETFYVMSYRCEGHRHFSGREHQAALSSPVWRLLSMPSSSQALLTQEQIHTRSHEATWRGYSKLSSPLCKLTVVRKIQLMGQIQPTACLGEVSLEHSLVHSRHTVSVCFCTRADLNSCHRNQMADS